MDEGVDEKGCPETPAGSLNVTVGRQLQDPETGYRRKVTIIGKKSLCSRLANAATNLERIRAVLDFPLRLLAVLRARR